MKTEHIPDQPLRDAVLTLDTGRRVINRSGELIQLPPLSYRLFFALASAAPNVVTHEELIDQVWNGRPVSAETVTQRIMLVRRALDDDASDARYIGLVRGQGYRMLQPVHMVGPGIGESEPAGNPARALFHSPRARYAAFAMALAAIAGVTALVSYPLFIHSGSLDDQQSVQAALPSIAVLPLKSHGVTDGDASFVDGIHGDILTKLAELDSLRVVSRTSVERLRDMSIREIGTELDVDAVLEGGVQRSGDRIRMNVQLIDTASDTVLWVDSFDEELTLANVFSIQNEIATRISQSMRSMFSAESPEPYWKEPTQSLAAYNAYQRGVQLLRRRTSTTIESAIGHFNDAIHHDPEFAAPYVGLADGYQLLLSYGSRPPAEVLPKALIAAKTAIRLDPENGAAYASLATIYSEAARIPGDVIAIEDPEPLFLRALRLSPNYATGYQWYGEYLSYRDRSEDANAMYQRAIAIDPLSPILHHIYAHSLMSMGEIAESEKHFLRAIEIDPGFSRAYQGLATHYFVHQGRVREAVLAAEQAALLNPAEATNYSFLSNLYVHLGEDTEAERWLTKANRVAEDAYFSINATTFLHLSRGDYSAAVEHARNGYTRYPRSQLFVSVLKNQLIREGRLDAAMALYDASYPNLLSADSEQIARYSNWPAIDYAFLLKKEDRHGEARALLDRAEEAIAVHSSPNDHRSVIRQAAIHTLRNDTDAALESLRRAVDMGWRASAYYYFEEDPNFDAIRSEPEFQSLEALVRADLAAQARELRASRRTDLLADGTDGREASPL